MFAALSALVAENSLHIKKAERVSYNFPSVLNNEQYDSPEVVAAKAAEKAAAAEEEAEKVKAKVEAEKVEMERAITAAEAHVAEELASEAVDLALAGALEEYAAEAAKAARSSRNSRTSCLGFGSKETREKAWPSLVAADEFSLKQEALLSKEASLLPTSADVASRGGTSCVACRKPKGAAAAGSGQEEEACVIL